MKLIMQAIGLIQQALPGLPPGQQLQQDALKAVTRLSKHIGQGAPTAGVQQTQLQDLLRNVMKNALLQRIMGSQGQQGRPPGAQGSPGPMQAASAGPPMPSTPLPGA